MTKTNIYNLQQNLVYVETSHVLHLDRDLNELKLKIKKHDAATSGHLLQTSLLKWLSLHDLYFFFFNILNSIFSPPFINQKKNPKLQINFPYLEQTLLIGLTKLYSAIKHTYILAHCTGTAIIKAQRSSTSYFFQ